MNNTDLENLIISNRNAYLEWIKVYCRNEFIVDGVEQVPEIIELIIRDMITHDTKDVDASSESLGDYSITYNASDSGYPKTLMAKLQPYIKVRFV